ncbi:serine/threonine-protein kinase [Breznakia blatticola]|uniref:non-specific serine/threonine protein kinase n=1 Tax=Breznakia blatticola TaxID=1754012 RepID=A0A4V3G6U0_9FIRM|nr:Stk1 family PASTA domain-containing Ser/Thr kinase [Breznakia blatticola]TDW16634.1 serine/threonine-protein kinase [Breznakia blatticola]
MSEQTMIANRYMVVSSIGSGGMADVYLAIDTILNREVAIKVLRGDAGKDPVALVRFQREASATSKLHHPNVVEVYDVGEYDGRSYIVMEYVRGKTLKQLIRQRGALPVDEAVSIMKQLTSAVAHAHENNIIHRDIKPQNVLVKDDGTVKITDFGIALAHDAVQLTQSDSVLGSAHYIAPETTRGEIATVQTDIYSLGIVFYELLTGDVPFNGENPVQIAMKHMREDIPSVRDFNKKIPQSVENIIILATAKNKKHRYASANDMLFDLEVCLAPEMANVAKVVFDDSDSPNDGTVVFDETAKAKIPAQNDAQTAAQEVKPAKKKLSKKAKIIAIAALVFLLACATTAGVYFSGAIDGFGPTEYVEMPNLEGYEKDQAEDVLKKYGLELGKVTTEVTEDDSIQEGEVFKQSKKAGDKVAKGSKINITISGGTYFVIENYVGKNIDDIRSKLEANNITVEVKEEFTEDDEAGTILSQSGLSEGTKIKPNEKKTITFTVSKGKYFMITNYVGKQLSEVKPILEAQGIVVSVEQKESSDFAEGQIIEQKGLSEGDLVEPGKNATITLVVSKGESDSALRSVIGWEIEAAKSELSGSGYTVKLEVIDRPDGDTSPIKTVIKQSPEAGSTIKDGATVTLYYYQD